MAIMKRLKNVSPGGRRKHRKGAGVKTIPRKDDVDDTPENSVIMNGHDSHHWQVRLDECDSYGPVTVYDAQGQVVRIISKDELIRPWAERAGNTWNNSLFPKRISDRVTT